MIRTIRLLFALLAVAAAGLCHAGGSVSFEDVERLIRTQPATYKWLSTTLELPDMADAEIRFGQDFTHLGGARMGPYTFRAKIKGSTPPVELDVTVCTTADFFDKSGRSVTKSIEKKATRVEEKLAAIQVRDVSSSESSSACPAR